jgi:tetratricopeptide (TPR) repeat protein
VTRGLRYFTVSVFLAFSSAGSAAQGIDWARVHETTVRGINHLYNLDVEQAENAFDSVVTMAPTDPRGPFFKSILHFYLYGLNRSEEEYNKFFAQSDHVIDICEQLLEQNEKDPVAKFYLGGIHGYRGVAYQTGNSILRAVQEGRKGYQYLEEAVTTDPTLYDAHMGFGLFRYLVAKVPRAYRWILNVIGFSGDLEGGLASLRLSAEKGLYTRTESRLYLFQFLLAEHHDEEAMKYIQELLRDFPDNSLFAVLYSSWQMRLNNYDEAFQWAKKGEEINSRKKIKYGEEFIYSTLGGIYFVKGDFAKANDSYEIFFKKVQTKDYISNWISYRYAVSAELTGNRSRAIEICKQMKDASDRDRAMDTFYFRKGQELIASPLSDVDVLIIQAGNELSARRYDAALQLYSEAVPKAGPDADRKVRALYGMQQVLYEQGRDDEVVRLAPQVFEIQPRRERWVIPHAYFKVGQAYARLGKKTDARAAFEAIDRFDGYDFQNSLTGRTEDELRKVKDGP